MTRTGGSVKKKALPLFDKPMLLPQKDRKSEASWGRHFILSGHCYVTEGSFNGYYRLEPLIGFMLREGKTQFSTYS